MNIALLIIGDEILSGETLDTNARYITQQLNKEGFNVSKKLTVGDRLNEIIDGIKYLFIESDFIITTGGLGPTKDDVTKYAFCEYFQSELVLNNEVLQYLQERYTKAGRELTALNQYQAMVPAKAKTLINPVGTAPVFWFNESGKSLTCLPGVPTEMRYLIENVVLPELKTQYGMSDTIIHQTIQTIGVPESTLAEKISHIESDIEANSNMDTFYKLAYLPELGNVKLRITGRGRDSKAIEEKINGWVSRIQTEINPYIFGYGNQNISEAIGEMLLSKGLTLSTAESCTGGYLAHLITNISGSSAYYNGSIISYANEVKVNNLSVDSQVIDNEGAVSQSVAEMMVKGALKSLNTDIAVSTTGIAGPNGGSDEKPIGTVWIAVGNKEKVVSKKYFFNRNRTDNIHLFAISALDMVRKFINENY
jgi:nicotinamide-nucleotide amidase